MRAADLDEPPMAHRIEKWLHVLEAPCEVRLELRAIVHIGYVLFAGEVTFAVEMLQLLERVGELERKIGQQQVELDFFRQALRHIGEARRPSDGSRVKASTASSRQ